MQEQIIIVIEMEMIIEALLSISVTAFHFSVVTRRPWSDPFMSNTQLVTGEIKRMNTIRLFGARITEFTLPFDAELCRREIRFWCVRLLLFHS